MGHFNLCNKIPDREERRRACLEDNAIYHNYTYINTFDLDKTKAHNNPSTTESILNMRFTHCSAPPQVLTEISHGRNRNTNNSNVVEMHS